VPPPDSAKTTSAFAIPGVEKHVKVTKAKKTQKNLGLRPKTNKDLLALDPSVFGLSVFTCPLASPQKLNGVDSKLMERFRSTRNKARFSNE
jgi:hypothetical protein